MSEAMGRRVDDTRSKLEVPEYVELAAGIVVVEANETDYGRLVRRALLDAVHEPLPVAGMNHLALLREVIGACIDGGNAGCARIEARGLEDQRLEFGPCTGGRVESVATAQGSKLIAAELPENRWEPVAEVVRELPDEAILAPGDVVHLAAEEAAEIEKPPSRDDGEHGLDAGKRVDR